MKTNDQSINAAITVITDFAKDIEVSNVEVARNFTTMQWEVTIDGKVYGEGSCENNAIIKAANKIKGTSLASAELPNERERKSVFMTPKERRAAKWN